MTVLARPGALATLGAALLLEAALLVRSGITEPTALDARRSTRCSSPARPPRTRCCCAA